MKRKIIISIIFNVIVIVSSVIGVYIQALRDGLGIFKWYTDLSNMFAIITALLSVTYSVLFLSKNKEKPEIVKLLNMFSTACLTLTFLVVAFVLAPSRNPGGHKEMMFSSFGLYLHTISPLVAIINFILFDSKPSLKFKTTILAICPTWLYAFIAIILNLTGTLDGPYFFLRVKSQSVGKSIMWIVVLSIGAYLINLILWFCNKKLAKD